MYYIFKRKATSRTVCAAVNLIAQHFARRRRMLKGSQRMVDERILKTVSAPLPLTKTNRRYRYKVPNNKVPYRQKFLITKFLE
jgi:hypothetical protein